MADPGILGISGGAAFGAVTALYLTSASTGPYLVPAAAFVSALIAMWIVILVARGERGSRLSTLLLCGIAVAGVFSALTSLVLSLSLAEWEVGKHMLSWLMGDLEGRTWMHLGLAAPIVVGGSVWLLTYARELNVLLTGEESAMSLGIDVRRVRRTLVVLASLVTASTVAVTGVVGFVGLMVPHIGRLLVGPLHGRLLPASFWGGALFLVWADTLCRVLPVSDLRLGVVTALTGGPFFLLLIVRSRKNLQVL
jgi:iron complex transport system permease protein